MVSGYTYSEVGEATAEAPESLRFDLYLGDRTIPVTVSREALEDHQRHSGVTIANLAEGCLEYLRMFQPDFAELAAEKVRAVESVTINGGDVTRKWPG